MTSARTTIRTQRHLHPSRLTALAATTTVGALVLSVVLAACTSAPASTAPAAEEAGDAGAYTLPIAARGDTGATTDMERTLDRIAAGLNEGAFETADALTPGEYDVVGARRLEDWAVEYVYRYAEPVNAEARTALILGGAGALEDITASTLYPFADRLGAPDTSFVYSYFQPDGSHIISVTCKYYEVKEGTWQEGGGLESEARCSEFPSLHQGYRGGDLIAP